MERPLFLAGFWRCGGPAACRGCVGPCLTMSSKSSGSSASSRVRPSGPCMQGGASPTILTERVGQTRVLQSFHKLIARHQSSEAVSQLTNLHMLLFCHSGLDPWFDRPFDRLTVLSEVEGESRQLQDFWTPAFQTVSQLAKLRIFVFSSFRA